MNESSQSEDDLDWDFSVWCCLVPDSKSAMPKYRDKMLARLGSRRAVCRALAERIVLAERFPVGMLSWTWAPGTVAWDHVVSALGEDRIDAVLADCERALWPEGGDSALPPS